MSADVEATLGTTCPKGGEFYVCDDKPTKFVGCCEVDPCKTDDGVCPDDSLKYTSYDQFSHNQILPQSCVSEAPEVQWWTCGALDDPFMGCCSVNPCGEDDGCPDDKLFAAKLSDNEDDAAVFLPSDGTVLSKGAIAGISAGGAVLAIAIIAFVVYLFLKRRKRKQQTRAASTYEPYANQQAFPGSPQSTHESKFNPFSPYPSAYATPSPGYDQTQQPQQSPTYWQQQGHSPPIGVGSPSPYMSSVSPNPSQGPFRDSMASSAYGGSTTMQQQPIVGELPGVSEGTTWGSPHAVELGDSSADVKR